MRTSRGPLWKSVLTRSNPAGFIHPHGMLHGLLMADQIDRGSMVISSKVRFPGC